MLRINYGRLSTKVLGNLSNRVIAASSVYAATLLKDNPLLEVLKTSNDHYQQVLVKNIYSGLGDPVAQADLVRDRLYRAFRRMLQGLAVFSDTARGQAARALLTIFEESGDVNNLSYADQNIVMQTLLKRMDKPESTAHLSLLGLLDEYTALKNAQMAFEKISAEQTEANSVLRQQASASGIRRSLERSLRDLFSLVSAMENVSGWSDLYHDLNELIKEARQSNRTLKKEGGDGDQEGLQP